ncbi:polysaccharide pyruvyl transferase family protein [Mucilaginibacter sp. SP1R1]|uniref:polysaccharide pyruvyl transferase family protein n=1 Tax=Mucilaginibacter sp. SP1R1 TaxID=2723091 RepID=UPI0016095627|nr:polysaccharide pyruvyl transferase family protein [Mucilaginibacter sp. SP1R1]MBB6152607.1 hypothetical protein [Mucilaginibacter sp. SP1R1]
MKNKFGLITYEGITYPKTNIVNVGDYIQSIAARQFLPQVDTLVSREGLQSYNGENIKMIMNAWYMANPTHFPPSPKIDPLYVSIHINSRIKDVMLSPETIAHFKKHEPIGCRDEYTANLLRDKGVEAYFTACMTLTLGKTFKRDKPNDEIYIVDPMFDSYTISELLKSPVQLLRRIYRRRLKEYNWRENVLNSFFTKELLTKAKYITQLAEDAPSEQGFKIAEDYLNKLRNAKLVITSRIHCALPCLAMGVPVIFIQGGFAAKVDNCRFDGIVDFFNRIDVDLSGKGHLSFKHDGKIGIDSKITNQDSHVTYAKALEKKVQDFVNQ